jgi:hypothetical protein
LGIRAEINHFNCKKLLSFNFVQDKLTHPSITPSFHYSNLGEAPKFLLAKRTYPLIFQSGYHMRPSTATISIYKIIFLRDWQDLEPMTIQLKRK